MTNTYNIAGAGGSVMVPVVYETGSQIACILYTDPTGTLQELYGCKAISRQYLGNSQAIPRQSPHSLTPIWDGLYQGAPCAPFIYKNTFGCTSQPIIHNLKTKKMAKSTATSGVSADRINNDPAFERTLELEVPSDTLPRELSFIMHPMGLLNFISSFNTPIGCVGGAHPMGEIRCPESLRNRARLRRGLPSCARSFPNLHCRYMDATWFNIVSASQHHLPPTPV